MRLQRAALRRLTRELLKQVEDSHEVVIADAAHYPNLEHPDQFNAALSAFLQRLA